MPEQTDMKFFHHDLQIELDDQWWAEAEMNNFIPTEKTYRVDIEASGGGLSPCLPDLLPWDGRLPDLLRLLSERDPP